MTRAILVSAAAFAALAACADDNSQNPESNRDMADTELSDRDSKRGRDQGDATRDAPDFDQDMAYYFSKGERGPALSFGVPRTDNIALNLRCPPGSSRNTVLVSFNRPPDLVAKRPDTITLKAGGASQQLAIETQETQLGTTVEVAAIRDGPVMQAYRRGDNLNALYGEETIAIPSRAEDAEIEEFFDACLA
ncbi:MAG: hypothetical protein VYE13_14375 [Pseudomonadota bacterium]|nr:hypothetical protein [Pseudomonadota bacterium]